VQNKVIKEKLADFAKSELPITQSLVLQLKRFKGKWGEAHISERQQHLADIAYRKIWVY